MAISYDAISTYLKRHGHNFEGQINKIKKILLEAEGKEKKLIYLTKARVKSADSIYLKIKRNKDIDSLDDITDYAGFRILCLFEQDIAAIHQFIIRILREEFNLHQFKLFNWGNNRYNRFVLSLKDIIDKDETKIEAINKESGYKSIHYLFKQEIAGHIYFLEIQLRTLLQDVWGELEHTLSYKKGNIHPHIKKSFDLLSLDIEKNDLLMSHLKTISERETMGRLYSLEEGGPVNYFEYEDDLIPDVLNSEPYRTLYANYINFMRKADIVIKKMDEVKKAKELFEELSGKITNAMIKSDKKVKYFLEMEQAFLCYWEGGKECLDKSLEFYQELRKDKNFKDQFILLFRMGEIYFIKDEVVEALKLFDKCLELANQGINIDDSNLYRAKLKLAYYYWLLGQEYIDHSIEMINDAAKIFNMNLSKFKDSDSDKSKLINNMCFYYLEKYLVIKSKNDAIIYDKETDEEKNKNAIKEIEDSYGLALSKLGSLMEIFNEDTASANMLDTVAWFHHHIYLKEGKTEDRDKAQHWCQLIGRRENYSTFKITSLNIHINHIQEIMTTK